jgi:hypothetical protein
MSARILLPKLCHQQARTKSGLAATAAIFGKPMHCCDHLTKSCPLCVFSITQSECTVMLFLYDMWKDFKVTVFNFYREGMLKLKDVYANNPALGDPNMLDKKVEENAQKLDTIRQELHKFEVSLRCSVYQCGCCGTQWCATVCGWVWMCLTVCVTCVHACVWLCLCVFVWLCVCVWCVCVCIHECIGLCGV